MHKKLGHTRLGPYRNALTKVVTTSTQTMVTGVFFDNSNSLLQHAFMHSSGPTVYHAIQVQPHAELDVQKNVSIMHHRMWHGPLWLCSPARRHKQMPVPAQQENRTPSLAVLLAQLSQSSKRRTRHCSIVPTDLPL